MRHVPIIVSVVLAALSVLTFALVMASGTQSRTVNCHYFDVSWRRALHQPAQSRRLLVKPAPMLALATNEASGTAKTSLELDLLSSTPIPTPRILPAATPTLEPTAPAVTKEDIVPKEFIGPTSAMPSSTPIVVATTVPSSLQQAVNDYRTARGLGSLETRADLCQMARERVNEIKSDFSHAGFERRLQEQQLNQLSYQGIAENIWHASDPKTNQEIVTAWDASSSHRESMQGDWRWGCGELSGGYAAFLFLR